jgi:hypothetical protein
MLPRTSQYGTPPDFLWPRDLARGYDEGMKPCRYSLASLLIAMSCVGIGFALKRLVIELYDPNYQFDYSFARCVVSAIGGGFIGLGIGFLFKRPLAAGIIGFVGSLLLYSEARE